LYSNFKKTIFKNNMLKKIALAAGDGIGPEVMKEAVKVSENN
jgi:isocitrate/isopropylmalate dehydrogenase